MELSRDEAQRIDAGDEELKYKKAEILIRRNPII